MKLKYQSRFYKKTALALAMIMFLQAMSPVTAWALTSGPTQPEVQSFEPIGSTQMVDLFSGDFNYNIPLLEVPGANGGYPINLFYNSVTNIEEEASMVGLGWNIGIGALTNNVRGLPDALNGERVRRKTNIKPNWTIGLGGKINFEFWGADADKGIGGILNLGLGMKFLYNSYKGFGYSIDPGIGINMGNRGQSEKGLGISTNFGFSLNSLEGVSSNGGVSLTNKISKTDKNLITESNSSSVGLSIGMSGREGLKSLTLSASKSSQMKRHIATNADTREKIYEKVGKSKSGSGSSTYSFTNSSYTPRVDLPYGGTNISLMAKFGVAAGGLFTNFTFSGFFSSQWLKNRDKWVSAPAYGYMHSQNAYSYDKSLMDFNREKDGAIYLEQPNLAVPIATPDILSVAGHGVGGSYRAYRSDWGGIFVDPVVQSRTAGGGIGVEFGTLGVSSHVGINLELNYSENKSLRPFGDDYLIGDPGLGFYDYEPGEDYEPYYYKAMGEITAEIEDENYEYLYDNIGGDMPIQLSRKGLDFEEKYIKKDGNTVNSVIGKRPNGNRKPRSSSIQPITNGELLDGSGVELLPEYTISFYDYSDNSQDVINTYTSSIPLTRDASQGNQIAGYTVLNNGGSKWNYALPVMNHKEYQASFSVKSPPLGTCSSTVEIDKDLNNIDGINYTFEDFNTDEYKDIVETPSYAHAHLLTSVLGADYIDSDEILGPSDGDQGYWMNVEYVKTSEDYLWKSPYFGATFLEGFNSKDTDDKATFMAGSREQYYPGRIVTNTHVAEFIYSKRQDSRGAENYLQNEFILNTSTPEALGDYSYKLDTIKLYSKIELENNPSPEPIKTVHFEYSYELCRDVDNNDGGVDINTVGNPEDKGKLTLKKVWFTYEQSDRGRLSPYTFEYNDQYLNPTQPSNPNYGEYKFDRWGVYRNSSNGCENINEPYTKQFDPNSGSPIDNGETLDSEIASWHLTDIFLPSGSHIHVDLGRDHYAYVQDRTATQMFKISRVGLNNNKLNNEPFSPQVEKDWRVYFYLEEPIDETLPAAQIKEELTRYIDDLYKIFDHGEGKVYSQLFFKINADLTNHGNTLKNEDVSGYAQIEDIDVDPEDIVGGYYNEAYIKLKPFPIKIRGEEYHPMTVSNWQYLKTNLPDQMFGYDLGSNPSTVGETVNLIGQFGGMLSELISSFKNYYKHCADSDYGRNINLDKSFIRLNSPDKKKYGGGVRVNKVTMSDTYWGTVDEEPPTYGVVYEYEIDEEEYDPDSRKMVTTGRKISSGVATNEPSVGKEECALRYSKSYENEVKSRPNNLFVFEYPINESYYPGPSVGYSKVSVKSLASEYALRDALNEELPGELPQNLPDEFAVSGMTVNEFYTAKDFPIITEETEIDAKTNPHKFWTIPLIATFRNDKYTATQGYMIELNDMHGKPKSVTSYAQDKAGFILDDPVSSVEYKYQEKDQEVYTFGDGKQRIRHRLDNMVTVLLSEQMDLNTPTQTERDVEAELGVERELFTDARETKSLSISGGLDINGEFLAFLPIPVPWINIGQSGTHLKTAVTNKIIRRSGILKQVTASDGKSKVITDNICFDRYSGQPILTTVNNSFDDKIYNYSIPGHFAYEQMGPAYQNWGLKFEGTVQNVDPLTGFYPVDISTLTQGLITADLLNEGDEFILSTSNGNVLEPITRATFIRRLADDATLLFDLEEDNTGDLFFNLVRSGNRNHLDAIVGNITSLELDPTKQRFLSGCRIPVPCENPGPSECTETPDAYTIQNVLNASAVTYSNSWYLDNQYCDDQGAEVNPYKTGEMGVWRPYRNFAYVVDRSQTNPINLKTDGVFNDFIVFDWGNSFITDCSNWRLVEETTKYGPQNQALESKNLLDIYNAALYGYNGYLPTAVGANTSFYEIGFEGFEEYEFPSPSVALDFYSGDVFESGHIDLLSSSCSPNGQKNDVGEIYQIIEAVTGNSSNGVILDKEYNSNLSVPDKAILNLVDVNTKEEYVIEITNITNLSNSNGKCKLEFSLNDLWQYLPEETAGNLNVYTGHVSILNSVDRVYSGSNEYAYFVDTEAHTGKQSLQMREDATFYQGTLNLVDGKDYVFSCWIKVEQPNSIPVHTYDDGENKVNVFGTEIVPEGPIVEGWQRIEGTFTFDENQPSNIRLFSSDIAYFDDFRIFPEEGNIVTYVYDKANYRVTEVLDNNNYYTRYKYDSEGNLISVQKETREGLMTLQESGSYVRANN